MEPPIIFEHGYHTRTAKSESKPEVDSTQADVAADDQGRVAPLEHAGADRRPSVSRTIVDLSSPVSWGLGAPSSVDVDAWPESLGVRSRRTPSYRLTSIALRLIDVALSIVALALLFPLLLAVALVIKLDSRGPVLFMQDRVGYNGTSFRMFKFRSMTVGAELLQAELWSDNERDGPVFKIKNDPRVTRIGRLLRHYSIDELPQLLNVLIGDMSLVGPRPALPMEVAMYTPYQILRLGSLPGITGLWQISGRANLSFDQSIDLDLEYIRTRSVRVYLSILLKTIPMVIKGDGAY